MLSLFQTRFPAMAALFELRLLGPDEEQLAAVAALCQEEIERAERLLSRFDPAAETARLNRAPPGTSMLVSPELAAVIADCRAWHTATAGAFAPFCGAAGTEFPLALDVAERRARWLVAGAALDLGGYGKGYALDCVGRLCREYGVTAGLAHGGGSSVLAFGSPAGGEPWQIELADPWRSTTPGACSDDDSAASELPLIPLTDQSLSVSFALPAGEAAGTSDIRSVTGQPLEGQAGCVVRAPRGTTAEALSTALLAMGKPRAMKYLEESPSPAAARELQQVSVGWLAREEDRTQFSWLRLA